MAAAHPLDNPLWNALTSEMAQFGTGTALAKRFGNLAVALIDHSDAAFADLLPLIQPGPPPVLIEAEPPTAVPGLTIYHREPLVQMVWSGFPPQAEDIDVVGLTMADAPEIAALVELTEPGPFSPEMLLLGPFFGLRVEGRLVSVSGERVNLTGYREVCTVCTHPDFQGRGCAARVVSQTAKNIIAEGKTPFLHVRTDHDRAQRLYERLGFRIRRELTILVVGHPSNG